MKSIVNKPWGSYQIIDQGENFVVKNIVVKPYGKLSLQSHKHRSEHWVIVEGKAEVTLNDEISVLEPNQSIYILENLLGILLNTMTVIIVDTFKLKIPSG